MASEQVTLTNLVQQLSEAIVYTESANFDTNRKLWNQYAKDWKTDAEFVAKMAKNIYGDLTEVNHVQLLGDEWSDKDSLEVVLSEFFLPHLSPSSEVAEVGSGGGRVASKIAPHVKVLHCFDIASEMLKKAKDALNEFPEKTHFHLLMKPELPSNFTGTLDFIYAFDVFPHVDLHTQWQYILEFKRVLKPGGKALLHVANLTTEKGWNRFSSQKKYTVGGFYFVSPDILKTMVARAKLTILKISEPTDKRSLYFERDLIVLLEKS